MQLKKHIKDLLSTSDYNGFDKSLKGLKQFYEENYIKKLTVKPPRPRTLIGQNCFVLIQTNLFRSKKLTEGYIDSLNKQNPLVCTLTVRALFETTGVLAILLKKHLQYIEGLISYEEFDKTLQSLYLGTKIKQGLPDAPDPLNAMKLIDAVDNYLQKKTKDNKEKKFRLAYDDLSEVAHPNSFGYFLGHKVSKDLMSITFTGDTEPFPIGEYKIDYFEVITGIYKLVFNELKQSILLHEELPYNEI